MRDSKTKKYTVSLAKNWCRLHFMEVSGRFQEVLLNGRVKSRFKRYFMKMVA